MEERRQRLTDTDSRATEARLARGVIDSGSSRYVDLVAKYYGDPEFRARMDADPAGTLRAEGFEIPAGAQVRIVTDSRQTVNIVLPPAGAKPAE